MHGIFAPAIFLQMWEICGMSVFDKNQGLDMQAGVMGAFIFVGFNSLWFDSGEFGLRVCILKVLWDSCANMCRSFSVFHVLGSDIYSWGVDSHSLRSAHDGCLWEWLTNLSFPLKRSTFVIVVWLFMYTRFCGIWFFLQNSGFNFAGHSSGLLEMYLLRAVYVSIVVEVHC